MSTTINGQIAQLIKDNAVVCVYGFCRSVYSMLIAWLREDQDRYLLFIQEDELQFLEAKKESLSNDPQVRLFYYQRGDVQIFSQIAWEFVFLKIGYLPLSQNAEEFFKELTPVQHAVELLASDWRDAGKGVVSNLLNNFPLLNSSLFGPALKDSCKGIPAIVCAAGASLDAHIASFSTLEDRALIIAGGTAINALQAYGITPHLAAYLDPAPDRYRFFNQRIFETPLFYQSRFSSELLSFVHGRRIWMPGSGNYSLDQWLATSHTTDALFFDSGWTVATFCVAIALYLGCDPLILAGMDFSCLPGRIYAADLEGQEHQDRLIALNHAKAEKVYSQKDWLLSAQWIAESVAENPLRKWINLSQGIEIAGVEKQLFSDVAPRYFTHSYDLFGHLHSAMQQAQTLSIREEKSTLFKDSCLHCIALCTELLSLWEKYFPHSPTQTAEYTLIDVDLNSQVCFQYYLQPLWNVWKYPLLRKEQNAFGRQLHRLLFFKHSLENLL